MVALVLSVFGSADAHAQERGAQPLRLTRVVLVAETTTRRVPIRMPALLIAPTRAARQVFDVVRVEPWVRARRMGLRISAQF